ncbi:MAG: Trk system potassium transporter TrkA [Myxococcota bacterium]|nr:Trk system potassium transporter TrkA [Myxococcota bacterium]
MKTLIIGAGVVGFNIAERLSQEGHDVTVVESNSRALDRIKEHLDVRGLRGYGSQPDILMKAGIGDAEMIVAVTDSDEVNMIACINAAILSRRDIIKIARVREASYCDDQILNAPQIAIDLVINPERVTAEKILGLLRYPAVTEITEFAGGLVQMIGLRIAPTSPLAGVRLVEFSERFPAHDFIVVALLRDREVIIPRGNDVILPGDEAFLTFKTSDSAQVLDLLGIHMVPMNRVMILGGTEVGRFLTAGLIQAGIYPKLIEPDAEVAEAIAAQYPEAIVVHGSPTDGDLLLEENAGEMHTVVACAPDEEVNVMASLLIRRLGSSRIIMTTSHLEYGTLIKSIGVNVCLSPRHIAVSSILRFIRHGRVVSVQAIGDKQSAEALEFEAQPASDVVGKPLHELRLPAGSIIAALVHDGEVVMPIGSTVIEQGDHVVVMARQAAIPHVEHLLQRRVDRN